MANQRRDSRGKFQKTSIVFKISNVFRKKGNGKRRHKTTRNKKNRRETIVIDETHSPGRFPSQTDEFFGIAATRINNPQKMKNTTTKVLKKMNNKIGKTKFLKYNYINKKLSQEVDSTLKTIKRSGAETHGVYIIKKNNNLPKWWHESETFERHVLTLGELIDEVFSNSKQKKLRIILDHHDNYAKGNAKDMIQKKAEYYNKIVEILIVSSKKSKHKKLLQAQDAVAWTLGEYILTGKEEKITLVGMNPKEITNQGRIVSKHTLN